GLPDEVGRPDLPGGPEPFHLGGRERPELFTLLGVEPFFCHRLSPGLRVTAWRALRPYAYGHRLGAAARPALILDTADTRMDHQNQRFSQLDRDPDKSTITDISPRLAGGRDGLNRAAGDYFPAHASRKKRTQLAYMIPSTAPSL